MNAEATAIELDNVTKMFWDFWMRPTVKAVDSLSLRVSKGEVFGLLGPNGSGKSTAIKMILGLLRPTSGKVRLAGLPPETPQARAKIGYLPELSRLHPFLTVEETLAYYAGLCAIPAAEAKRRTGELVEMTGLGKAARRRVGTFSKGMARKVALCCALVGAPEILILDEPTSGLDPVSTDEVKTLVKTLAAGGMTVLTTSHLLADTQDICTRFAILDGGRKAAEGDIAQLRSSLSEFFLSKVGESRNFKIAPFLAGGK